MYEQVRLVGILMGAISVILFLIGTFNDNWVSSDNGHWGLFKICDKSSDGNRNLTSAVTNAGMTTVTLPTTIHPKFGGHDDDFDKDDDDDDKSDDDDDDDDDEDDDDDDDCTAMHIFSLPAFLHAVRFLVVIASIVYIWGFMSRRTLDRRIQYRGAFMNVHCAEISGIIASASVLLGLALFRSNYKSIFKDKFPDAYLNWCYYLVQASLYLYFPSAILMMAPSLRRQWDLGFKNIVPDCCIWKRFRTLCDRIFSDERSSRSVEERAGSVVITRDNVISSRNTENGNHDLSFPLSEADSDVFTVTIQDEDGDGASRSSAPYSLPMDDLPQYEDLEQVPQPPPPPPPAASSDSGLGPPPSYEDVITRGYLAFSPSSAGTGSGLTNTTQEAAESHDNVDRLPTYESMV